MLKEMNNGASCLFYKLFVLQESSLRNSPSTITCFYIKFLKIYKIFKNIKRIFHFKKKINKIYNEKEITYDLNSYLVPYSREHLNRVLNKVFKTYDKLCNRNLLSHSCRISFITRICKIAGVDP